MIEEKENAVTIDVKVIPKSSKNEGVMEGGVLRLKLTAPPVDGKANAGLVTYLAKALKISKSSVSILRGETSREKLVSISGVSREALYRCFPLK